MDLYLKNLSKRYRVAGKQEKVLILQKLCWLVTLRISAKEVSPASTRLKPSSRMLLVAGLI